MNERNLSMIIFIGAFIFFLVGLNHYMPDNAITGNVIRDDVGTCDGLGCFELCDYDSDTCQMPGETCCFTHWESGICDIPSSCDKIREYSLYQTLETYQDSVRERPAPISTEWKGFWIPIILVLAMLAFFAWQRADPYKHHNKR